MDITILLESIIIGAIVGIAVGAGAARMFHAPEVQAAGAFRTMGEMNACMGDPISHISFGFSFFVNTMVNNLATGCMDQDFLHRVIPNFAAGILSIKNKKVEQTVYDPFKMAIAGGAIGAIFYALINTSISFVPAHVSETMPLVINPAISNLLIVMDVLYILAALDNGKYTGSWGLVLGAISYLVVGSATPGAILGILTGKTIELNGVKSKISIVFIILMVVVWILIAYFRGFHTTLLQAFM